MTRLKRSTSACAEYTVPDKPIILKLDGSELSTIVSHDLLDEAEPVEQTIQELHDRTGSSRPAGRIFWPSHEIVDGHDYIMMTRWRSKKFTGEVQGQLPQWSREKPHRL